MAGAETDRNILFGILAWQCGLLSRAALMEAMYECTIASGGRTLPQLLLAKSLLSDEDCARLNESLERRIRAEQGDLGKTLASFDSVEEVRAELTRIAAAEPGATLASVEQVDSRAVTRALMQTMEQPAAGAELGFDGAPPLEEEATTAAADPPEREDRRFRVVRKHARGGLGEVFVALDEQLKREVALKQILPKQAENASSRARFLLEAEITGNLEHPGIVPVYALGTATDGAPYYAMRFIRGASLEDAIARFHESPEFANDAGKRAIELRNLLSRFTAVCNTIEYSHSRGIIHRDIKPENIMLGPYGETLVVDWGLARSFRDLSDDRETVADDGEAERMPQVSQSVERPTQMGAVVGTPQFMSPEQASGRLDLMGPASDVYSLGATLYCLLTNQPAFTAADVRQVLKDVREGFFDPPRTVNSDVPRGLDAVCRKAMALEAKNRYESARALGEDVERWLADEAVSALPEAPIDAALRWLRRHRTLARAGGATLAIVACVAGVAYMREAALRSDLQVALANEETARAEADVQRKAAVVAAEHARGQNQLALSTLKNALYEIQTSLKNIPAAQTARINMLTKAVAGLSEVAKGLESSDEADQSLVRAHIDLGDIFVEVGDESGGRATALAEEQFLAAARAAEKLLGNAERKAQAETDLGDVYQRLGDVCMRRGRFDDGTTWLKKSLDLRERLSQERPGDAAALYSLALSVQRVGLDHFVRGEWSDAERQFTRFADLSRRLVAENPKNWEYLRMSSVADERMADVALREGDEKRAEGHLQRCLETRRRLVQSSDNVARARRDLSVTCDQLGRLAQNRNDYKAAEALFLQSLDLRRQLFDEDPQNVENLRNVMVSCAQLGDLKQLQNDPAGAADYFRFQSESAEELVRRDPENARYSQDLAASLGRTGDMKLRAGKTAEARDDFARRVRLLEEASKDQGAAVELQRELSVAYFDLGEAQQILGDLKGARETLRSYLSLAQRRAAADGANAALKRVVTDARFRLGTLELRIGDYATSAELLNEALGEAKAAADKEPEDDAAWQFAMNVAAAAAASAWEARDADAGTKLAAAAMQRLERLKPRATGERKKLVETWWAEWEPLKKRFAEAQRAAADAEFAANLPLPESAELVDFRIAALVDTKQPDEARRELERLATAVKTPGPELLVAARAWARLAGSNAPGARDDAGKSIAALEKLYDAGLFRTREQAEKLELDPAWSPLRGDKAFQGLLKKVEAELNQPSSKAGDTVT
ncbi:MAG: protein kinase [Planctomycetaceae bacterium]|nr:protein kinase [Planctomycetaceae bacterium]